MGSLRLEDILNSPATAEDVVRIKIDPNYEKYIKKAAEGTRNYGAALVSNTSKISKLRKKKTRFWFISIVLNSIGGVLAVISSFLKENKNNRKGER